MKRMIFTFLLLSVISTPALADQTAFSYADDPDWVPAAAVGVGQPVLIKPSSLMSTGAKVESNVAKKGDREDVPPILRAGVGRPKKEGTKVFEMPRSFKNGCGNWPICSPFYKEFKACEPTCEPINYASQNNRGDGGRSCHNSGRAIDVFGMKCSDTGKSYMAINNGRFQDMVRCVQKRGKVIVLWHNGRGRTKGHYDHGHFSIKCHGGSYW